MRSCREGEPSKPSDDGGFASASVAALQLWYLYDASTYQAPDGPHPTDLLGTVSSAVGVPHTQRHSSKFSFHTWAVQLLYLAARDCDKPS